MLHQLHKFYFLSFLSESMEEQPIILLLSCQHITFPHYPIQESSQINGEMEWLKEKKNTNKLKQFFRDFTIVIFRTFLTIYV